MDFSTEKKLWGQGYKLIAGVDEAGRGPLAGPVVVAAVILQNAECSAPMGHRDEVSPRMGRMCRKSYVEEIRDSKKLTAKKREELFEKIKENAICVGVGISSHQEIDEINILQATLLAMRRAIKNLNKKPDYIIVDGRDVPFDSNYTIPQHAIVRGDSLCPSIAAASIVAKVTRDRLMRDLALQYPGYKFEKHKGYPTREHINILKEVGPCPIHRRSFGPVREYRM